MAARSFPAPAAPAATAFGFQAICAAPDDFAPPPRAARAAACPARDRPATAAADPARDKPTTGAIDLGALAYPAAREQLGFAPGARKVVAVPAIDAAAPARRGRAQPRPAPAPASALAAEVEVRAPPKPRPVVEVHVGLPADPAPARRERRRELPEGERLEVELADPPGPEAGESGERGESACLHSHLKGDTCLSCGAAVFTATREFNSAALVSARSERSLLPDMKSMQISEDIKQRADLIYRSMTGGVRRNRRRLLLIFYCLYQAHHELGIFVNPEDIAAVVGINKRETTRSLSMFSVTQTGYRPVAKFTLPTDVLPYHAKKLGLEEATPGLLALAARVVERDKRLLQESPFTVSAGICKYYLAINGLTRDAPLHESLGLSEATIAQMFDRVSKADNR